jgi:hypothetical protein
MLKKLTIIALTLSLSVLLCSCARRAVSEEATGRPQGAAPALTRDPAPRAAGLTPRPGGRLILALVDATGSFGHLRESFVRLVRFAVEELEMGDTLAVGFIKSKLNDTDYVIPFTTLPTPTRRIGDPAEVEALAGKQRIQETLLAYAHARQFAKVTDTDLNQAVAYAGRLLREDPREKWLLLFTDLEDTERQPSPWRLDGIHVRAFFVPARGEMQVLEQKERDWGSRFTQAKAASVQIYDVGQTRALSALLTPPNAKP